MAIVKATIQTSLSVIAAKFGKLNCPLKLSKLSGTGTETNCFSNKPKEPPFVTK